MRTSFAILYIIAFFCILISCQKEIAPVEGSSAGGASAVVNGDLKAKFNGTQWVANKAAGSSRTAGIINISGISVDKKVLTITMQDSGVHRYLLTENTLNAAALVDSTEANRFAYTTNQGMYPATSGGEVNITAIDTVNKKMSGTFSFKVFRLIDNAQKTVTEGSFTNLSYITSLPASVATDTFKVKINGTAWVPSSVIGLGVPLLNQIAVNATDGSGTKAVGLAFPATITPGNYTLDFFGFMYYGQYNPDADPLHSKASASGTLTILEHNTTTRRIRGTFQFRGEELANAANFADITEGYFSVRYQ